MDDTTTPDAELMSIGRFSSLSRLSVRMLRHYDEHGVLAPAHVDPHTGYRSYAAAQLSEATIIRRLRDVGFGVSSLPAVLAARGTDAYAQALRLQRLALADDARAAQQRLTLIEHLLTDLQEDPMSENITVRRGELPAMTVVALRGTVPTYSDEGLLWQRFMPELERQGVRPIGPGGVIEHDLTFVESGPDESVWVPVAAGTTVVAPLTVYEVPARPAVIATMVGPYSRFSEAHSRIGAFLADEGLAEAVLEVADGIVGGTVNVYLTDPSQTPEDENVTEVYRLIA